MNASPDDGNIRVFFTQKLASLQRMEDLRAGHGGDTKTDGLLIKGFEQLFPPVLIGIFIYDFNLVSLPIQRRGRI
jgi:hypothetical protein